MHLKVEKAGILDSFQDSGRNGYRRFGVNPNGAMDKIALRASNMLLGNDPAEAALEMHFPAPVLKFQAATAFVINGADFGAELDGRQVVSGRIYNSSEGQKLKFSGLPNGRCCYLSVKNGFELDPWLESTSTNLAASKSGFGGRKLRTGDLIELRKPQTVVKTFTASQMYGSGGSDHLEFIPGPAFRDLTAISELEFRRGTFMIGRESNRMGFRLEGKQLFLLDDYERLSSAVTIGTMQLLPNGQIVILMADHQTTGGYPNLGTIIETDISLLAQMIAGELISFRPIAVNTAEKRELEIGRDFAFLKTRLGFENRSL